MPSMDELPSDWSITGRNLSIGEEATEGTTIKIVGRDDCLSENSVSNNHAGHVMELPSNTH